MKLLRLNPTGFFSYGEHGFIPLDGLGVVHLKGVVGAGKSSVFNTLCEILFGMSPQREGTREVGEGDVVNCTLRKACGTVVFESEGHTYRVIYLRDWSGPTYLDEPSDQTEIGEGYAGTTLHFEWWNGAKWIQQGPDGKDLRYPKMSETWSQVARVLGCDYETFCTTGYIAQGQALRFIKGKNSDREEIITQIKRLKIYDEWEVIAKGKGKESQGLVSQQESAISTLRTHLGSIPVEDPANIHARLAKADETLTTIITQMAGPETALRQVMEKVAFHQGEANRLRAERDECVKKIQDIAEQARQKQYAAKQTSAQYQAAIAKVLTEVGAVDLCKAADNVTRAKTVLEMENQNLRRMMTGAGKCGVCGTAVTANTLAKHREEQESSVAKAHRALTMAEAVQQQVVTEVNAQRNVRAAEIRAEAQTATETVEREAANILATVVPLEADKTRLQAALDKEVAQTVPPDVRAIQDSLRKLQDLQRQWVQERASAQAALEVHAQRAADRERLIKSIDAEQQKLAGLQQEVAEWTWLAKHYPRVKQLKFVSVLKDLNDRIAHYLGILTDGSTQVVLSPYRVKKGAEKKPESKRTPDDYIFEFGMTVEESGKEGVPIQLYSGGERAKITLALVGALWDLASSQGNRPNVLLLDEVIHNLDSGSIEQTVRFLDDLRERVDTLILVGHDPTFPSLLNPDVTWTATKSRGTTTLQTGE